MVIPCHEACAKGQYKCSQEPGSFTTIINAIVKPLNMSKEINILFESNVLMVKFLKNESSILPTDSIPIESFKVLVSNKAS